MSGNPDRLYDLIPVVHRMRDAGQGYPLRALLRVIGEQVDVVEQDIAQLYENWFIETCEDWVVPYIGALVGYQPADTGPRNAGSDRFLEPRRDVANAIRFRSRKGAFSILDDIATSQSGWPSRAVEFYRWLAVYQNINALQMRRGHTFDARGHAELQGPFNQIARTVDVRRISTARTVGNANIPDVGIYVWRLKPYSVTHTLAYCHDEVSPNCYLFSPLGSDTRLFNNPAAAPPRGGADLKYPSPIRRRSFERREVNGKMASGVPFYYGEDKSLAIWTGDPAQLRPVGDIVPADLSDWTSRPYGDQVAVDPERGRIMFPPDAPPKNAVWVSYTYGFSADMGGGEYVRPIRQAAKATLYQVGTGAPFATVTTALAQWRTDKPEGAVIEIVDSSVYFESIHIVLEDKQTLQLRAANGKRPVLWMVKAQAQQSGSLTVEGKGRSWFILDGVIITGRGLRVQGEVAGVAIRHATLVPGLGIDCDCNPRRASDPSIELIDAPLCLTIEHSIVGRILVERDEARTDPVRILISDSILDATGRERVALGASSKLCAYATLVLLRSTVFGELQTEAIELAEDSIIIGEIMVCRRQKGCMRFCYAPPGSRTPRRYRCQPDLVEAAVAVLFEGQDKQSDEYQDMLEGERLRVAPDFNSMRYGNSKYAQLANACAIEISTGAEDESEMGAFHDLYQSRRLANLRARIADSTPAGINAGVILTS